MSISPQWQILTASSTYFAAFDRNPATQPTGGCPNPATPTTTAAKPIQGHAGCIMVGGTRSKLVGEYEPSTSMAVRGRCDCRLVGYNRNVCPSTNGPIQV